MVVGSFILALSSLFSRLPVAILATESTNDGDEDDNGMSEEIDDTQDGQDEE